MLKRCFTLIGDKAGDLPHAIIANLHVRKSNVVILTPEMVGTVDV